MRLMVDGIGHQPNQLEGMSSIAIQVNHVDLEEAEDASHAGTLFKEEQEGVDITLAGDDFLHRCNINILLS